MLKQIHAKTVNLLLNLMAFTPF